METTKAKFCPALWLSGFFAMAGLVHLVRFFAGFSLIVGGYAVSLSVSGIVGLILTGFSVLCLGLSLKRPCAGAKEKTQAGGCCAR